MDVSDLLASHTPKPLTTKDVVVDPGLLTVTDLDPIDPETYATDLESHLRTSAQQAIQALLATLATLPTQPSPDGPLVQLPPPSYALPRSKPLPRPKPPTKWERFAATKGICKTRRERKVWDEERQAWVDRWGKRGRNKDEERAWIHEVKANAPVDADPVVDARQARKARVAKNERQRLQNVARAQASSDAREERKSDIERTLVTTRTSTASMGKFDKKLEGDKKMRGVKRKFDPAEASVETEKQNSLALLSKLDGETKRARKETGGNDVLNVRKAIRTVSKGKGGVALGRQVERKGKKGAKR